MSQASTIPATEAELAEAKSRPLPSPAEAGPPVTPEEKIRRRNTTVLSGPHADQLILAPDTSGTQPAGKVPSKTKNKSNRKPVKRTKKSKGKAGGKSKKKAGVKKAIGTQAESNSEPAGAHKKPGTEMTSEHAAPVPAPKLACKKAAAKKPEKQKVPPPDSSAVLVKIEPKIDRDRRKLETSTPQTVKDARAVARTQEANMTRSTTREQMMSPSPAPALAKPVGTASPSTTLRYEVPPGKPDSQSDGEVESDAGFEAEMADLQLLEKETPEPPVETQAEKKVSKEKRVKEKTPQQRAAHARYMRFSRSLTSVFDAISINLSTMGPGSCIAMSLKMFY